MQRVTRESNRRGNEHDPITLFKAYSKYIGRKDRLPQ
jgi:hypothetical protein